MNSSELLQLKQYRGLAQAIDSDCCLSSLYPCNTNPGCSTICPSGNTGLTDPAGPTGPDSTVTGPTGPSSNTIIYPITSPYSVVTGTNNEQKTVISDVPSPLTVTTTTSGFLDTNNGATGTQMILPLRYNMMSLIYNTSLSKWLVGYRSTGVIGPTGP